MEICIRLDTRDLKAPKKSQWISMTLGEWSPSDRVQGDALQCAGRVVCIICIINKRQIKFSKLESSGRTSSTGSPNLDTFNQGRLFREFEKLEHFKIFV